MYMAWKLQRNVSTLATHDFAVFHWILLMALHGNGPETTATTNSCEKKRMYRIDSNYHMTRQNDLMWLVRDKDRADIDDVMHGYHLRIICSLQ